MGLWEGLGQKGQGGEGSTPIRRIQEGNTQGDGEGYALRPETALMPGNGREDPFSSVVWREKPELV